VSRIYNNLPGCCIATSPSLPTTLPTGKGVTNNSIMPDLISNPCRNRGCKEISAPNCRGYCQYHKQLLDSQYDITRDPNVTQWLKSSRYRDSRQWFLTKSKHLCVRCGRSGDVLDHIHSHSGDYQLFWNVRNWQCLCKKCHDRKTAMEDGGFGRVKKVKKKVNPWLA